VSRVAFAIWHLCFGHIGHYPSPSSVIAYTLQDKYKLVSVFGELVSACIVQVRYNINCLSSPSVVRVFCTWVTADCPVAFTAVWNPDTKNWCYIWPVHHIGWIVWMDVPVDMASGVLDGVCCSPLNADATLFSSQDWRLLFNISSLFCAYLSLSFRLFNSFGSIVCPAWTIFLGPTRPKQDRVGDIFTWIADVR
jgi:hypothetical protein